ncbi:MAG: glycine cleavage system aminomethyltransferase GcvT [Anaerolineae bacterium]
MAKKTALYERHEALGGRMVEFAGWMLPVQYLTGPKEEHLRVRQTAGLFDIDHMGQVVVSGPDALSFLQMVMTADVAAFGPGTANYSLLCYDDGGVVDDTFIYNLPGRFFIAINAANNAKDTRWLQAHTYGYDVTLENVSDSTYMLALQGPAAQSILQPLCEADLSGMAFHTGLETVVAGVPTLVGRTGYTGEDGFELYFPTDQAVHVWDAIVAEGQPKGLLPIGLAARDSLRFEAAMPLYGQEISATRDPLGAGLGWAVSFHKGPFIGREALLKVRLEGSPKKLVGFQMTEGGVPRHGYEVAVGGVACGEVTSGMYAPTLDGFLGLAYVPAEHSAPGTELQILIRNKPKPAVVVKRPFYTPAYRR